MKKALVCGAGGFIGTHLVSRLKSEGMWVRGADRKIPEFSATEADDFIIADLRDDKACEMVFDQTFDEVYQLAADMGGAGFVFTGDNDTDIMMNSSQINLNVLNHGHFSKIFYSSSACVYPYGPTEESLAYPANPDSEYGWEKLFSERLYQAYSRNYKKPVAIARYHNVFGPLGTWQGRRAKAPAAICRKVAEAVDGGTVEIWGDGAQTRSFLHVDECIEGTLRLMRSDHQEPINIGSSEWVTIDELVLVVAGIAGKSVRIAHVPGPVGVRGRNSDNALIRRALGWTPSRPLVDGLRKTYAWVQEQVDKEREVA